MNIVNLISFPDFKGIKCIMMPFIQGDASSLPKEYQSYADIINNNFLQKGEVGYLTIDESFVEEGTSQRGYNSYNINRNVHIEVSRKNNKNKWGSDNNGWGRSFDVLLEDTTEVLIANNIDNTCMLWDVLEKRDTVDGDLSNYIDDYKRENGIYLKAGELARMSIFTPHECINQLTSGLRQFFRIVGKEVSGREEYFTINPLMI